MRERSPTGHEHGRNRRDDLHLALALLHRASLVTKATTRRRRAFSGALVGRAGSYVSFVPLAAPTNRLARSRAPAGHPAAPVVARPLRTSAYALPHCGHRRICCCVASQARTKSGCSRTPSPRRLPSGLGRFDRASARVMGLLDLQRFLAARERPISAFRSSGDAEHTPKGAAVDVDVGAHPCLPVLSSAATIRNDRPPQLLDWLRPCDHRHKQVSHDSGEKESECRRGSAALAPP